jgi:SAM-dependent methyltransferase
MMADNSTAQYALGDSDAEHERLIRQAQRIDPSTERLFREAGIGRGHRVLDLGSGVGDVALLTAKLVGETGEVVGIERDSRSIARARARAAGANLRNVSFLESDVSNIQCSGSFDAAVGRFILQFVHDPVVVLHHLAKTVRPGGVVVFQEVSYAPLLALSAHLPLWSACISVARETIQRAGANPEMGVALHQNFQEAGLPPPAMRMEMLLGSESDFTLWIYDLLCSLQPQIQRHKVSVEALGDFKTLPVRLQSEVGESKSIVPYVALVGAWSQKP